MADTEAAVAEADTAAEEGSAGIEHISITMTAPGSFDTLKEI